MSGFALSLEEQVDALVAKGAPRDKAEAAVYGQARAGVVASEPEPEKPTVALPFTFTVPWTLLVADNEKTVPQKVRTKDDRIAVKNCLTAKYAHAKKEIQKQLKKQTGDADPFEGPAHVVYRFYWPDRRRHDAANMLKLLNDCPSKIVYRDDAQLHRGTWTTAVDPDRPRCEIEIRPL